MTETPDRFALADDVFAALESVPGLSTSDGIVQDGCVRERADRIRSCAQGNC